MNLRKHAQTFRKTLGAMNFSPKKWFGMGSKISKIPIDRETFPGFFKQFGKQFDLRLPTVKNFENFKRATKITGVVGESAIGATLGGLIGGPVGIPLGAMGLHGARAATTFGVKSAFKFGFRHPNLAAFGALGIHSSYNFAKPILGPRLMETQYNRPTNPALPPRRAMGPGYVTMGNQPRVRLPHNNLGATGDLTLALRKLRHGRRT